MQTLTLKNIPTRLHVQLKEGRSAGCQIRWHQRSHLLVGGDGIAVESQEGGNERC